MGRKAGGGWHSRYCLTTIPSISQLWPFCLGLLGTVVSHADLRHLILAQVLVSLWVAVLLSLSRSSPHGLLGFVELITGSLLLPLSGCEAGYVSGGREASLQLAHLPTHTFAASHTVPLLSWLCMIQTSSEKYMMGHTSHGATNTSAKSIVFPVFMQERLALGKLV